MSHKNFSQGTVVLSDGSRSKDTTMWEMKVCAEVQIG